MRDPKRIDSIVSQIKYLWHQHPDWRLCQLIENLVTEPDQKPQLRGGNLFNVEDNVIEESAAHVLAKGWQRD